jgi:hypothetical protein
MPYSDYAEPLSGFSFPTALTTVKFGIAQDAA